MNTTAKRTQNELTLEALQRLINHAAEVENALKGFDNPLAGAMKTVRNQLANRANNIRYREQLKAKKPETADVVKFINDNTDYETMECLSTKEVAEKLNLSVPEAYKLLKAAADKKEITYLEPLDGNNLNCADWVRNHED